MKLGDVVTVSAILEKQQEQRINTQVTTFVSQHLVVPIKGIYIGYRTAQTGRTIYYTDDGPKFRPEGKVKYLLVATNERKNPIKADPNFTI